MSKKYSRRSFLKQMSGVGTGLICVSNGIYLYGCDQRKTKIEKTAVNIIGKPKYKKVILLGMDGLDPKVLFPLMMRGELPNFLKLGQAGSYSPLITSLPAHSPVAWASIATGNNPGYHGIFDFLNRRVKDYIPELAIFKINSSNFLGRRESMFLPVMQGNTFWDYTSSMGIPSTIIRWPVTFQPKKNKAKLYAGLGVPDLNGRLGKYSFFTTKRIQADTVGAGKITSVRVEGDKIKTYISGPKTSGLISNDEVRSDLNITLVNRNSEVKVEISGKTVVVKRRQWSDWIEVKFKVGILETVTGIVKFYLNDISPEFELYMTPVQINPKDPAFVISNPDDYIKELADELGHFYTLGISEDTKALSEGRLDEEAFITMCNEIMEEQEKMLWYELNRFNEGLFSFGFFSTDRIQHMFWATKDKLHPLYSDAYARKFGHVIDDYYRWMDRVLGEVMNNIDESTAIMAFSDHGFSTYRRSVHLNTWLAKNGFIGLKRKLDKNDKDGGPLFQYVDWNNTYAYSLGFGSIYLNLKGREKHGIVEPGRYANSVLKDISSKLLKLKDTKDGRNSVKNVYMSSNIYSGGQLDRSPDIVVGFQEGYRASWQTAIGGSPFNIFDDNLEKWSGDHIVDPSIVPGILFSNFKRNGEHPSLLDIAPSVLSCFGMSSSEMEGTSFL